MISLKGKYRDFEVTFDGVGWACDELNLYFVAWEGLQKAIDRFLKKFDRFEAYHVEPGEFSTVNVTSWAGLGYSKKDEMWISRDGKRSKVSADTLFETGGHNEVLIAEIERLQLEIEELETRVREEKSKLVPVVVDPSWRKG